MGWALVVVVVLLGVSALWSRRGGNRAVDDAGIEAAQRRDAERRRRAPRDDGLGNVG